LTTFQPILIEAAAAVEHGIITSNTKLQIIAMLAKFQKLNNCDLLARYVATAGIII
jgi:hypothetical protein